MAKFSETSTKWYEYFDKMKVGQKVDIGTKSDPELFIDMCKNFIDLGKSEFEFSDDYKYFKRIAEKTL